MRGLLKRLDIQLSAVIALIVALWFASFLYTTHLLNVEKAQKAVALEEEKINARMEIEKLRIMNDILLDHNSSLEIATRDLYRQLGLARVELETVKGYHSEKGAKRGELGPLPKGSRRIDKSFTIAFGKRSLGKVRVVKDVVLPEYILGAQNRWLGGIALALIIIFFITRAFIARRIIAPINALISSFGSDLESADQNWITPKSVEMEKLVESFRTLQQKIKELRTMERKAGFVSLASKVAHDMRPHVSALGGAINDLVQRVPLPEEEREVIRTSLAGIQDTANLMLDRTREDGEIKEGEKEPESVELIASLVESVVSIRRQDIRSRLNVRLLFSLDDKCYGLFAKIQSRALKNALSNIIVNAFQAIENEGDVTVHIGKTEGWIEIVISDTGKGIPKEVQPNLMKEGYSYGKEKSEGRGFGLSTAKEAVESWGGRIRIKSELGRGTEVTILLPKAGAPEWFIPQLRFIAGGTIVVLDDDPAIHRVWKKRFQKFDEKHQIEVHHFTTAKELAAWHVACPSAVAASAHYLIDYELIGQSKNGIQVIEELGIKNQSVLVTSRHEEKRVLEPASSLRIPIIPKTMASFAPIVVGKPTFDCVLIDDEIGTHMAWNLRAKKLGKTMKAYSIPEDFFSEIGSIDRTTPIYVDAQLAGGLRGELVAKEIHERGFENLYLATGYENVDLTHMPWFRAAVQKDPPWPLPKT